MIKYVIQLKDGVNTYYAHGDREVANRWTSQINNATRWPTRERATEFITSIRAILNPVGSLHVREIQVADIPDYSKVTFE